MLKNFNFNGDRLCHRLYGVLSVSFQPSNSNLNLEKNTQMLKKDKISGKAKKTLDKNFHEFVY